MTHRWTESNEEFSTPPRDLVSLKVSKKPELLTGEVPSVRVTTLE